MANENIEGAGAKAMSSSHSTGKGKILDYVANQFLYNSGGRSTAGSGSSASSKGKTGNGWTPEDYKNYGDWQERHYGLHNDSEDKKTYREAKGLEAKADIEDIAKNKDFGREIQRKRLNSVGYGPGAQGTSQQQKQPGGKAAVIGKAVGAVAGAAITKSSTGTAAGAKAGEKVATFIGDKITNRKPRGTKA